MSDIKNKIIDSIQTDSDFSAFLNKFKKKGNASFTDEMAINSAPLEIQLENDNIAERVLIRSNIYTDFNIDIHKLPFIVCYQNNKIKGFKTEKEAADFSRSLLLKGTHSLLVYIMNHEITSRLFN